MSTQPEEHKGSRLLSTFVQTKRLHKAIPIGYIYLKEIVEKFDKATLPASSGDPRIYAAPRAHLSPHENKNNASRDEVQQGEPPIIRMDPLVHALTRIFLPHRCETSTCLERFQAFHDAISPSEWGLTASWKTSIEQNSFHMRSTAANWGVDAAVSLAMKRWAERILGDTLENIFISKIMCGYGVSGVGQQYALGLSALYKEDPQATVYHYSSQQLYTGDSSDYGGQQDYVRGQDIRNLENAYNTQQKPQGQFMHRFIPMTQPIQQNPFVQSPIPIHPHRNQTIRRDSRTVGVRMASPTITTALDTDTDPGRPTKVANESKVAKSRKSLSQSKLPAILEGPNPTRFPLRIQHTHSDPIPNPSGRKTPPHKRSPLKRMGKSLIRAENKEGSSVESIMCSWTKEGNNKATKTITNKLTKGNKTIGKDEGSVNDERSPGLNKDNLQHADSEKVTGKLAPPKGLYTISNLPGEDKTNDVARTYWSNEGAKAARKGQGSTPTNKDGSPRFTNEPPLPPPSPQKLNKQQMIVEDPGISKHPTDNRPRYTKATLSPSGKNGYLETQAKNPITSNDPTKNSFMLAKRLPSGKSGTASKVSKGKLDHTQASKEADRKTTLTKFSASRVEAPLPQQPPEESFAIKTSNSKPNYAKAASGMNGRNEDLKPPTSVPVFPIETPGTIKQNNNLSATFRNFPVANPSKNQPVVIEADEESGSLKYHIMSSPKGPPLIVPSESPASGKSWSSIVKGGINEVNTIIQNVQHGNPKFLGYPKLGTPLTTISPNQPHSLKTKTSLSAEAKVFEPASIHHTISLDSYLHNTTPAATFMRHAAPVFPAPSSSSQSTFEITNTGYDPLLEILYNTPQFIEYLEKSYDWLLFKQNYLRAQYQRIQVAFEDDWDMITARQRKAVVTRALANLSGKIDRIQFREVSGVEEMLSELGLVTPSFKRNKMQKSFLRTRAEYCFDLDPDAFAMTPYWMYTIIGWLLGSPQPLRHRFGPAGLRNRGSSNGNPDQTKDPSLGNTDFWCPDDCSQCEDSEKTDSQTEWVFFGRNLTGNKNRRSDSTPSSPMMERYLESLEVPTRSGGCDSTMNEGTQKPEGSFVNPKGSTPSTPKLSRPGGQKPYSKIHIIKEPRLMSNRFQNPIFKPRSPEWIAAYPGRSQFMEVVEIDIALFYCELVEEILHIFGDIRRERVWFTLPTIWDWYDGPTAHSPQSNYQPRGQPRTKAAGGGSSRNRSVSCPVWGSTVLNVKQRKETVAKHSARLTEAKRIVNEERKRVWEFVKETQRTVDWVGCGLKLVDRESDREVDRAWDGGLWSVPVPKEEKAMLKEGFGRYCVWRVSERQ